MRLNYVETLVPLKGFTLAQTLALSQNDLKLPYNHSSVWAKVYPSVSHN